MIYNVKYLTLEQLELQLSKVKQMPQDEMMEWVATYIVPAVSFLHGYGTTLEEATKAIAGIWEPIADER